MMMFPAPYVSWEVIRIELRLTRGAGAIVVVLSTFMTALPAELIYARRCEKAVVLLTYVTFPVGIGKWAGQYCYSRPLLTPCCVIDVAVKVPSVKERAS